MVAITPDLSAARRDSIDRPGKTDGKPLDAAGKSIPVGGFDDEVHMIFLNAELEKSKSAVRCAPKRSSKFTIDAFAPKRRNAPGAHRDVHGVRFGVRGSSRVRHAWPSGARLPSGTTASASARTEWQRGLSVGARCHASPLCMIPTKLAAPGRRYEPSACDVLTLTGPKDPWPGPPGRVLTGVAVLVLNGVLSDDSRPERSLRGARASACPVFGSWVELWCRIRVARTSSRFAPESVFDESQRPIDTAVIPTRISKHLEVGRPSATASQGALCALRTSASARVRCGSRSRHRRAGADGSERAHRVRVFASADHGRDNDRLVVLPVFACCRGIGFSKVW